MGKGPKTTLELVNYRLEIVEKVIDLTMTFNNNWVNNWIDKTSFRKKLRMFIKKKLYYIWYIMD